LSRLEAPALARRGP